MKFISLGGESVSEVLSRTLGHSVGAPATRTIDTNRGNFVRLCQVIRAAEESEAMAQWLVTIEYVIQN
jgi:hypothetical protein